MTTPSGSTRRKLYFSAIVLVVALLTIEAVGRLILNHTRLGLAPRQLQNGDLIQIGRLRFHFRIQFYEAPTE